MTYIRVIVRKIDRYYKGMIEQEIIDTPMVFRNKQKFYDFCLSFFSPAKQVSYTIFSPENIWYQKWMTPAPYPKITEERSIEICYSNVKLNSYYVDRYDQALQQIIHTRGIKNE